MHRLATVHAHDNQPTTNDVTTQPICVAQPPDNVCFQTVALPAVGGCAGKGSLGDRIPPAGSRGKAPVGGLGGHEAKPLEAEAIH